MAGNEFFKVKENKRIKATKIQNEILKYLFSISENAL